MIPKELEGVSFGSNEKKMGWHASPTCQVFFDNVKVPAKNLLGKKGEGFKYAMMGLDGGRLNIGKYKLYSFYFYFYISFLFF